MQIIVLRNWAMTGRGVQWAVSTGLLVGLCLWWPACATLSEHAAGDGPSREQVQSQDDAQTARRAAEQGDAEAQFGLGFMYAEGRGVPQDDVEAVSWYRRAAEQGHAEAQAYLGAMCGEGRGIPQDYVMAHMWLNLAAAKDHRTYASFRDELAAAMTPEQVVQAQQLAREWKPKPEQ